MADVFDELEEAPDTLGEEIGAMLRDVILDIDNRNRAMMMQIAEKFNETLTRAVSNNDNSELVHEFNTIVDKMNINNGDLIKTMKSVIDNAKQKEDKGAVSFDVVRDRQGFITSIIAKKV